MDPQQQGVAPTGGAVAVPPPDFDAAERSIKRVQDLDALTSKIKSPVDVSTPQQRLQVAKDFKDLQPETSVLGGFVQYVMGNKEAARLTATQGRIQPIPEYDQNGRQLTSVYAENSKIPLKVFDEDGRQLSLSEYKQRRGGQFSTYMETPAGMSRKIEIEQRKPDFEQERAATYVQSAAAPTLKSLWEQQQKAMQELEKHGITDKEQNMLASYNSVVAGYTQNLSDAVNTMKQAQKDQSTKDALKKSGKLEAALKVITAAGDISREKAETLGSSELDQLYKTASSGQGLDAKFSQDKKAAFESAWYKNLSPEQKKVYEDAFQRANVIAQTQAEASKYGDLNIAPTPYMSDIIKQAGSGALQAVIGQFKADATSAFAEWRDKQKFPEGYVPSRGELQSAFTRTPEYARLKEQYAVMADEVEARSKQAIKNINQESAPSTLGVGTVTLSPKSGAGMEEKAKSNKPVPAPSVDNKPVPNKIEDLTKNLLKKLGG